MKKLVLTLAVVLTGFAVFAQNSDKIKYITTAPDGTVAMTIYDNLTADNMQLESAEDFYRYEILEPSTSEAVYSSDNSGKACTIDKNKLMAGTYNLRIYTNNFVITSKITVSASRKVRTQMHEPTEAVASNE